MRKNETQTVHEVFNQLKIEKSSTISNQDFKDHSPLISKKQLWNEFLFEFKNIYGKEFIKCPDSVMNIKVLFLYFLQDMEFFNCEKLRSDLSCPSFKKGLFIIGGFGVGKTAYMKVFEKIFNKHKELRLKGYTAKELVNMYESCATPSDKSYMMSTTVRPRLFIDDINSERIANNYGNCDVVEEILFNQNEKRYTTFVTSNHTNPENSMEESIMDIGVRYGGRIHDRFYEMFNMIDFTGKSNRR
ncbi:hypothetical protein [Pseudotamlana agarivorans]|uniref:hypothetical protein n=1 Tax=Pseudotamlana agarivorans TaxID=481183 RepID=UPI00082966EB|nr:hypothetical protein [Tamlana agarivorans]